MADKVLPSAFPHPVPGNCWGDPSCGMTLLDYFAAHCDQPGVSEIVAAAGYKTDGVRVDLYGTGLGPTFNEWWSELPLEQRFALSAKVRFMMARAMLNERQGHEG